MSEPRVVLESSQIDPDRTAVLAYQYGGFHENGKPRWRRMRVSASLWLLDTFPKQNIYGINICPYLCARNAPIRDVILPNLDRFDDVLSIDYDVTPTHPGVSQFLSTPGDVVACKVKTDNPHAWDLPTSFHTPFWRAKTKVFAAVEPPWFWFPYSDDGCEMLSCDCAYFAEKVLAAGFSVTHGGRSGHQCGAGVIDRPIGKPRWYYRTVDEGAVEPEGTP